MSTRENIRLIARASFDSTTILLKILCYQLKVTNLLVPHDAPLHPILIGPRREKTCLRWFANNKGADKPAHPGSLISAFAIRLLVSIVSKLAASKN